MAKGLKMETCRKAHCGDRVFKIGQLSKVDNGTLRCCYCNAEVIYTSGHSKANSTIWVPSYLRLARHENHDDNCPNTLGGRISRLASESRAIENATPILEQNSDGTYSVRLNILNEAAWVAKSLADEDRSIGEHGAKSYKGSNYVKNGRILASYFRSAAGVAKIRALISDSSEVDQFKRLIRISYKDGEIPWDEFYYDRNRYKTLIARLERGRISHPVALAVTIKDSPIFIKEHKYPWNIKCFSVPGRFEEGKAVPIPGIKTKSSRLANMFDVKRNYVVLGNIWLAKAREPGVYRNFYINVFDQSQFAIDIETA